MSALPMTSFTDWMRTVPVMFAGGRKEFINNAVRQTYRTLALAFFGRSEADLIDWDAGSDLRVPRITRTGGLYQVVNPNAEITATNPQVVSNAIFQMRFGHAAIGWTLMEEERAIPAAVTDARKRLSLFKEFARKKEMVMNTDSLNAILDRVWANPHGAATAAAMENANAATPQHLSIPALITEDNVNWHPNGWTTVGQIDPASDDTWRNPVSRYNYLDPADNSGDGGGLLDALIDLALKCHFETPPTMQEYLASPEMRRQAILTSTEGYKQAQSVFRDSNDNWANAADPVIANPMVMNLPIYRETALDNAALYWNGTTSVGELDASLTNGVWGTGNWRQGPRYWFLNFNDILVAQHRAYFMKKLNEGRVVVPEKQPYSRRQDVAFWWNLAGRRRDTSGVCGPGAST